VCRSLHHHHGWDDEWYPGRSRRGAQQAHLVTTPGNLRVSDAERQRVIGELQHFTGEGRLTLDEFEGRAEEALRARTGNELRAVLRDLPPRHPQPVRPTAPRGSVSTRPVLIAAIVLAAIWLLAGSIPIWLLLVVGFFWLRRRSLARSRRRAFERGRDRDRDDVTTFV
jgi:Domain of unknown function (DUF1707)